MAKDAKFPIRGALADSLANGIRRVIDAAEQRGTELDAEMNALKRLIKQSQAADILATTLDPEFSIRLPCFSWWS
jgi:hypothetical protein